MIYGSKSLKAESDVCYCVILDSTCIFFKYSEGFLTSDVRFRLQIIHSLWLPGGKMAVLVTCLNLKTNSRIYFVYT